jgi:hypothetical protein
MRDASFRAVNAGPCTAIGGIHASNRKPGIPALITRALSAEALSSPT